MKELPFTALCAFIATGGQIDIGIQFEPLEKMRQVAFNPCLEIHYTSS